MAYISNQYCYKCKIDIEHINGECINCRKKLKEEKIKIWNSKTIDEKFNDINERLENLERGKIIY